MSIPGRNRRAGPGERCLAGVIAAVCAALLMTAAWLRPDASGFGTHRQIGLPPCGWLQSFGKPCMTCGMTTAFAAMAHAQPRSAWRAQPMGAALAVATATLFWPAMFAAVFGFRMGPLGGMLLRPAVVWGALGLAVAAWGYKVATWPG